MLPLLKTNKVLEHNVFIINNLSENKKNIKLNTIENLNNLNQDNNLSNNQTTNQICESGLLPNCFGNASTSTFVNNNLEIYERIKLITQSNNFQNEIINNNNNNGNELHSILNSSSFSSRFSEKLSAVAEKISSKFVNKISSFLINLKFFIFFKTKNSFASQKHNSEQNSEKLLLVPMFIDEKSINGSICQNSSVNVKFVDNNFTENLINDRQCRICLMQSNGNEKGYWNKKKLIAPCKCSGTVQYVHLACLTVNFKFYKLFTYFFSTGLKFLRKKCIIYQNVNYAVINFDENLLLMFVYIF